MASAYARRPWLRLYQPGKPADITPEHSDALSMWRAGLAAGADRPFLYYFGNPVTAATVEASSDALAVAFPRGGIGRGARIALFLQNMPRFVVGLLAAWKLGAIAVLSIRCSRNANCVTCCAIAAHAPSASRSN